MIGTLLTFVAGAIAALWYQHWRRRDAARPPAPGGSGTHGVMPTDRSQDALLAAFRPDELRDPTDALREDQRILADALRDIAKQRGATAAVLWSLDEALGGTAVPVASSADDARSSLTPAIMPIIGPSDRERIEWAARNSMLSVERTADTPHLAVVPLDAAGELGALSLHFDARATVDFESLRVALLEHARTMQSWYGLVRTRADVARQNFRLRGLIRTAGTLQATRDPLELERLLVLHSLPVSGAEWAMLVRWDEESRTGRVRASTPEARKIGADLDHLEVTADSVVGQVCTDGRPQVFADARPFARGEDLLFGGLAPLGAIGSLLSVPLRRGEHERPIGALVCGHSAPTALRAMEARNARNLGVIAAGALETAWQVEDARRNARTDPLTGLANRRGFDERFSQVVQETDRYGSAAALILVDIDFFKRVNDTYGHDGGDAVLVAVANALAFGRRTVDITARLGGEEFAVLLPQTDAAGAREVAERMRKRIEGLGVRTSAGDVRVTASFGVAEYVAREGSPERVVELADQALYAAKRNGRNRVEPMG